MSPPRVESIIDLCASHFGVEVGDIKSGARPHRVYQARSVAMYLARELTDYSFPRLARCFGAHDHSKVFYAVRSVSRRLPGDDEMKTEIDRIRGLLTEVGSR